MYNGKTIRKLLKERNLRQKDLLEYLCSDISKSNGSITQLESGNPTVKTLERIADFFNVPMDTFFERNYNFTKMESLPTNEYQLKIESLERLIVEKDKRIDLLEQLIQLLKNPNAMHGQIPDISREKQP